MIKLEKINISKSFMGSVGVHGLVVLGSVIYYSLNAPKTLELTGLTGNGIAVKNGISLSSIKLGPKPKRILTSTSRSRAVVRNQEREKVIAKKETSSVINDSVTEQASSVIAAQGFGDAVGGGEGGLISELGIGTGAGDFDGGVLFTQIKKYFESRLNSHLTIDEDQLIKVKLKLSSAGDIQEVKVVQGKLDIPNLRKVIAAAKNMPLKNYWKSSMSFPGELVVPLFLTSN